jgi:hypothetical protein
MHANFKLRKYVNYTWGCNTLDDDYKKPDKKSSCGGFMVQSVHRNGSSHKRNQQKKMDSISFNKKLSLPNVKVTLCYFLSSEVYFLETFGVFLLKNYFPLN